MVGNVVDYGFYLIQRGEAGHLRGAYLTEYKDSGGIETIGYGTVTRPGYNTLNYRANTITEELAVDLAKQEMAVKINEKCRTKFKDFDNLLPCYQAAILDTTYQGNWGMIQNAMNEHDMQAVYRAITDNPNRERAAVRGRAIEMGILIEQAFQINPNADPRTVAALIAAQMIEQYAYLNGTDCELSKDELALLYRSCMAAYGMEVSEEEIERFALGYQNVAVGMCGIGSQSPAKLFTGVIPQGAFYDGSRSAPYAPVYPRYRSVSSGRSRGYSMPTPFVPAGIGPDRFQPDSKTLKVSTSDVSCNFGSRNGQKPQMIVLHTTESPSYQSTKATFQSPYSKVSAHYVIDRDGTIHQFLPEGYSAWHAGDSRFPPLGITDSCNTASIGIEIQRGPNEPLTKEQIASAMALVKDIKERHGIPAEHVVAHSDIAPGRKADPGADFPWAAFAREGLATMNHLGVDTHAHHYNPALLAVSSNDCQFYKKSDLNDSLEKDKQSLLASDEKKRLRSEELANAAQVEMKRQKEQTQKLSAEEASLKQILGNAAALASENGAKDSSEAVAEGVESFGKSGKKSASGKSSGKKGASKQKSKSALAKKNNSSSKEDELDLTDKEQILERLEKLADSQGSKKKPLGENITNKDNASDLQDSIEKAKGATLAIR